MFAARRRPAGWLKAFHRGMYWPEEKPASVLCLLVRELPAVLHCRASAGLAATALLRQSRKSPPTCSSLVFLLALASSCVPFDPLRRADACGKRVQHTLGVRCRFFTCLTACSHVSPPPRLCIAVARFGCCSFCFRRMACFGSPSFDDKQAIHILSADSRYVCMCAYRLPQQCPCRSPLLIWHLS